MNAIDKIRDGLEGATEDEIRACFRMALDWLDLALAELRDRAEALDDFVFFPHTTRDTDPDTWEEDEFLDDYVGYCESCGRLASRADGDGTCLCDRCWDDMVKEYYREKLAGENNAAG